MRDFVFYTIGASIVAIAIGCGPGRELPDEVSHTKNVGAIPPDPGGIVPAASDPVAKAIADRAIKAITQNNPDLLTKARISRVNAKGSFQLANVPTMTDAMRTVQTVWPDRARVVYEFREGAFQKMTWGLHSQFGWTAVGQHPYSPPPNPTEIALVMRTDLMAQHWLLLGIGLTEPEIVFFDPTKIKTTKSSATAIKIGLPDLPVYQVNFDDQTGLPVRIEYYPFEMGQRFRVRRVVSVSSHQAVGGLLLPTVIEMTQNDKLAERWAIEQWEFPEKLDDAVFDPPTR
jgi:hypothetical protein